MALETAFQVAPLPVYAEGLDGLLRAYVAEIPDSLIRAIYVRAELLGRAGLQAIELLGVLSGVIFAAVTRASNTVRATWFRPISWNRMSRLLRGFRPAPPSAKVSDEKSPRDS